MKKFEALMDCLMIITIGTIFGEGMYDSITNFKYSNLATSIVLAYLLVDVIYLRAMNREIIKKIKDNYEQRYKIL